MKMTQRVGVVQRLVLIELSGGSLYESIMKKEAQGELFSEDELKDLLLQVSLGLKYIHSSGLAHMDIKPSNSGFNGSFPVFSDC